MQVYYWTLEGLMYFPGIIVSSGNTIEEAKEKTLKYAKNNYGLYDIELISKALDHHPFKVEIVSDFIYIDVGTE